MNVRMIAHDMRSPLNALHLSLQAALKVANPAQKEFLLLAERNAQVLGELIEKLLAADPSGAASSQLMLGPCLAFQIIARAIDQVAPAAKEKEIRLEAEPAEVLPPLVADSEKLIRVLVNLLGNAVKFTGSGGHICVRAKLRVNDGHEVIVFSVIDNGVGVAEGEVDHIFVEGVSTSRPSQHSTGLGLAVCKEMVEAHGGRIWIEPKHTTGSVFSFSIPTKQPRD